MPSEKSLHDYAYERASAQDLTLEAEAEKVRDLYLASHVETINEVMDALGYQVDAIVRLYMKHGSLTPDKTLQRIATHYDLAFTEVARRRLEEAANFDLFEDEEAF